MAMLRAIQVRLEKAIEINSQAYIIFFRFCSSKAFDNVQHSELLKTVMDMGFLSHLIALIKSFYTDHWAKIRCNASFTDSFNIGRTVRQGCILSLHLFSKQIMTDLEMEMREIKIVGRKVSNLRYAADTGIWVNNKSEVTAVLNKVTKAGEK